MLCLAHIIGTGHSSCADAELGNGDTALHVLASVEY